MGNKRQETRNKKSSIDMDQVASLANLELSVVQKKKFENQLKEVLAFFKKLNEIKVDNVDPIGQITGIENVTREDETSPSLAQEAALKNAPRKYNGFFEVDAIFPE